MSRLERYNHMLKLQNESTETQKTEADYTICNKMSVSEKSKSMVDYLFEQGKCGDICKNG